MALSKIKSNSFESTLGKITSNDTIVAGSFSVGNTSPARAFTIHNSGAAEIALTQADALANYRNWNILADGGTGSERARLRFRMMGDSWNSGELEHMVMDGYGRVTKPLQPSFFVTGNTGNFTITNLSDLPFNSLIDTTNTGNFNTTTYRFTAQVAGVYQFNFSAFVNGTAGRCYFKLNGGAFGGCQLELPAGGSSASITTRLAKNDYVTVGDWQSISGGVVYMGHSQFSGFLI